MDWKSTKLTNILLFIVTCMVAVVFFGMLVNLLFSFSHRRFSDRLEGCKMQGQYKDFEKGCNQEGGCPFVDEKVDATNVAE